MSTFYEQKLFKLKKVELVKVESLCFIVFHTYESNTEHRLTGYPGIKRIFCHSSTQVIGSSTWAIKLNLRFFPTLAPLLPWYQDRITNLKSSLMKGIKDIKAKIGYDRIIGFSGLFSRL
jgi:hypothetical protein